MGRGFCYAGRETKPLRRYINQYTNPTITEPPMMLPIVTGNKLTNRNEDQVRLAKSGAVFPIVIQNVVGAVDLTKRPMGIKYMFATLCSNPAATKAEIGKITENILSVVVRAL